MYKSDQLRVRIGACLRNTRRAGGFTLEQAAELAGMSAKTLSRIESGAASMAVDVLLVYARKLGTTAESIISQIGI